MIPGNRCKCGCEYVFMANNSVVFWFGAQPWASFVANTCPNCNASYRLFMRDEAEDLVGYCIENNIGFVTDEYAPDDIIESFKEVFGLKELPEYALTTRLDAEVQKLADVLEKIPDDLLWAELTDPETPHTMPERWI